jgi:nucleotide-binding universal stress UspA family protein
VKRILVGVDASPASVEALERAADEARLRGSILEVVHAFNPPDQSTAFPVLPEKGSDRANLEAEREKANEKLGVWLEESQVDLTDLEVEWSVLANNRATEVLIDRSKDADLVVVGSRGRGGFRGLLLGSTSEQVTRHAKCPVLVVRPRTR